MSAAPTRQHRIRSSLGLDCPLDPLTPRAWLENDRGALWLPVRRTVRRSEFVAACLRWAQGVTVFGDPHETATAIRVHMVPTPDGIIIRRTLNPAGRRLWWWGDLPEWEDERRTP